MPTALVTGAYGFLGRYAAQRLSREGWRVVGLGHGQWSPEDAAEWGVSRWISGDIDAIGLRAVLTSEPVSLVFHAGGGGSVQAAQQNPGAELNRSVMALGHLLDAMRELAPLARLIFPSSAAVYGACPDEPLQEDRAFAPVSLYGVHKVMCETLVRGHVAGFGLRAAIIRYFSIYGAGLRKQLLWDVCTRFQSAADGVAIELFGDGLETRDMLHVEDAIEIGLRAALALEDAPFILVNGGTGVATTVGDIAGQLAALYGQPAPSFNHHARPGDPRHYCAAQEQAHALGFSPRWTLPAGLQDFVAWRRTQG